MQFSDYANLTRAITEQTAKSYQARLDSDQKPNSNLANLGGKKGQVFRIDRKTGEYTQLAVRLLEPVSFLLTDHRILRWINWLQAQKYDLVLRESKCASLEEALALITGWACMHAKYPHTSKVGKLTTRQAEWCKGSINDPIPAKIQVASIGLNTITKSPVIPEDWIDREFDSGFQMHRAMDKLPHRLNGPPVTYAITMGLRLLEESAIYTSLERLSYRHYYQLDLVFDEDRGLPHLTATRDGEAPDPEAGYQFLLYGDAAIGYQRDQILEPKNCCGANEIHKISSEGKNTASTLVSRMQKCIRRGRDCSRLLGDTVVQLNHAKAYNLPERNFARVSANRQLVWRLFICAWEDVRPYLVENGSGTVGLIELMLLVLITQQEMEDQFTAPILRVIQQTAWQLQHQDNGLGTEGDPNRNHWYSGLPRWTASMASNAQYASRFRGAGPIQDAIYLALTHCHMMIGDQKMLQRYASYLCVKRSQKQLSPLAPVPYYQDDGTADLDQLYYQRQATKDALLAGYDHHCVPQIIIYYGATQPPTRTTEEISSYIWDRSSKYNVRVDPEIQPDPLLQQVQLALYRGLKGGSRLAPIPRVGYLEQEISPLVARVAFVSLFGQVWSNGNRLYLLSGDPEHPLSTKVNGVWEPASDLDLIDSYPERELDLTHIPAPDGFSWCAKQASLSTLEQEPYIDGEMVPWFDARILLRSARPDPEKVFSREIRDLILTVMGSGPVDFATLLRLRKQQSHHCRSWGLTRKELRTLDLSLIKALWTRFHINLKPVITVGPVDRHGKGQQNSISYYYEGRIWGACALLCYLHPDGFSTKSALDYHLDRSAPGYLLAKSQLAEILFQPTLIRGPVIKVVTKLWPHQEHSVRTIVSNYAEGMHGCGDASDVGAGKSLALLAIFAALSEQTKETFSGCLVLVPDKDLITTWADQIHQHLENADLVEYSSKTYPSKSKKVPVINRNTIVVATLGWMRDHPLEHRWLLMGIDECLSVQNKSALWTREAWQQSCVSKHLVMLSATFFRAKFEALYFMLKMLNTGIPERQEYLDNILQHAIVRKVPLCKRDWKESTVAIPMPSVAKKGYQTILQSDQDNNHKYASLASFLCRTRVVQEAVIKAIRKMVARADRRGSRCLIYAASVAEAEMWSRELGIDLYPELGNHCIVTVAKGTYGLNNLVCYDTLILRPPVPDKLPQMKGRLDRPGQTSELLRCEFFYLKDTIEYGLILRMSIANNFADRYIMPLSVFFQLSLENEQSE